MTTRRAAVLPVSFFERAAEVVARELVGCRIVSRVAGRPAVGRIVETEAYLGITDPASHAWGGRRNQQNASIYGEPGNWYVYRSYGVHWCANLVCREARTAAAVLLRAVEPIEGLELMRERRGPVPDRQLASGPGRLTVALGITRSLDGQSMVHSDVTILPPDRVVDVAVTPRIGITKAVDWPLRFAVPESPWTSRRVRA